MTPETVLSLLRQLSPREQLRVVSQILPELERDLPPTLPALDSWQGVSIAALAEQQAVRPIDDFDALLGGWPDEESIDEFLAAVRESRRQNLARIDAE
jgi:hypothetical protein